MNINGSLINSYFVCKRKAWLSYNKIGLEHNAENVKIGKFYHQQTNKKEIEIDNIKIDEIRGNYIIEKKKSCSNLEAAMFQIKYYLYILNQKGIRKKGKIYIFEYDKEIEIDYLTTAEIMTIKQNIKEIEDMLNNKIPPFTKNVNCKKCAYYEYCTC